MVVDSAKEEEKGAVDVRVLLYSTLVFTWLIVSGFWGEVVEVDMESREVTEQLPTWREVKALHARVGELERRLTRMIDGKKSTDLCTSEMQHLASIAGAPHSCTQEGRIASVESSVSSIDTSLQAMSNSMAVKRWFQAGSVLTVVIMLTTAAAFIVRSSSKTEYVQSSVEKIAVDIQQLKEDSQDFGSKVSALQSRVDEDNHTQLEEFKRAVQDIVNSSDRKNKSRAR
jgi:hypothetical protein